MIIKNIVFILFFLLLTSCDSDNSSNSTPLALAPIEAEFWQKGSYDVEVLDLTTVNAVVYSPAGLNSNLPVVLFAYGSTHSEHKKYHQTLLNFIASHGYHAVFITNLEFNEPEVSARNYLQAVDSLKNTKNVDTSKIGIVGHSTGGGLSFGILQYLMSAPNNYGTYKSFLLAIDPWFAKDMNQQDLSDLASNTNIVVLQFGEGGNHMENNSEGVNFSTDALIPLTIYKYLSRIHPDNVDYQIFENVGTERGHLYLYDSMLAPASNGNNYADMKGGLNPLGALMELTFA